MKSLDSIQKIRQLYKLHKSYQKVGDILKMPKSSVYYACKNDYERVKKKIGPKFSIPTSKHCEIRAVVKRLTRMKEKISAHKIKSTCNLGQSIRTIERTMSKLKLDYGNPPQILPLKEEHKKIRLDMAREWLANGTFQKNVVWTDEKRFSMDGPDNWCTWYDPINPPQRVKRQMKGGGIMVWGMTLPDGTQWVTRLHGKVNSAKYVAMLRDEVIPYLNDKLGEGNWVLQRDNCRVHTSAETKKFIKNQNIEEINWPSYSPDLNIQENCWAMQSLLVYERLNYTDLEELWKNVKLAVSQLNKKKKNEVKDMIKGYGSRLLKVIDNKGEPIPY